MTVGTAMAVPGNGKGKGKENVSICHKGRRR